MRPFLGRADPNAAVLGRAEKVDLMGGTFIRVRNGPGGRVCRLHGLREGRGSPGKTISRGGGLARDRLARVIRMDPF